MCKFNFNLLNTIIEIKADIWSENGKVIRDWGTLFKIKYKFNPITKSGLFFNDKNFKFHRGFTLSKNQENYVSECSNVL